MSENWVCKQQKAEWSTIAPSRYFRSNLLRINVELNDAA